MTKYWDKRNKTIFNKIGYWIGGENVFIEGKSLMNDIMENMTLSQLKVLSATGKVVSKEIADFHDLEVMCLSYPDTRIWCNQLAAIAADAELSSTASVSSCILGADSRAYGGSKTRKVVIEQLEKLYKEYKKTNCFKETLRLVPYKNNVPIVVGFARPVDSTDERIEPMEKARKRLGIETGKYLKFALELSQYLEENYSFSINIGGYMGACDLDFGYTADEAYRLGAFSTSIGALSAHRNGFNDEENSFLPMKVEDICYTGKEKRKID